MRKAEGFIEEHLGRDREPFQVLTYITSLGAETTGMQPHLDCGVQGQSIQALRLSQPLTRVPLFFFFQKSVPVLVCFVKIVTKTSLVTKGFIS